MNMSKHIRLVIVALIVLCAACSTHALYTFGIEGTWPGYWPKELEPLRKHSRTLSHCSSWKDIHEIRFTNREDFESAWPHILKVKSSKAPLILLSSPYGRLSKPIKAGVRIVSPGGAVLVIPEGAPYAAEAESSIPGGTFLKIRPPWPDYIKVESAVRLNNFVYENGKRAPWDLKLLRIGPPWPDHIKSESGALPEYVVYENGKLALWDPDGGRSLPKEPARLMRCRVDIELIVDGQIVDLNRIALPADTPIIDKRFQASHSK